MEKFLKEILIRDSTLITRRDDLIKILDEEVPNNLRRNYAAIRKALTLNIGEIFAVGNAPIEEKVQKARQLLKDSGMQETRIEGVINVFVTALDLQASPAEETKEIGRFIPETDTAVVPLKKSAKKTEENSLPQPSENIEATATKTETETETKNNSFVQEYLSKKIQTKAPTQAIIQTQTQIQTTDDEPEEEIEISNRSVNNNYQNNNYQNFEMYPDGNLNKIFTYEGRLNRWRYFTKSLKLLALSIVGAILSPIPLINLIGSIMILASAAGALLISVRRLHDLNKSGWFLLILLIPYVDVIFSIYLVFAQGTNGTNEYGRDPLIY